MTLINCKECNNQVSTQAKTCPQCGAKTSSVPWWLYGMFGLMVLAGIGQGISIFGSFPLFTQALLSSEGSEGSSEIVAQPKAQTAIASHQESATPTPAEKITPINPINLYTTKESPNLYALSEELLDSAIRYATDKDYAALQQLMDSQLVFKLKPGQDVYLENCIGFPCSKVKVRLAGNTISLYTIREAIQQKSN